MTSLNSEQERAVNHREGPLLVIAGAGSGKTRIVTERIVKLLQVGVPATSVLGLTFTNKAAEEMRRRVHNSCYQQVLISTFHSLGARILRESIDSLNFSSDFTIYDEEDVQKILRSCFKELAIKEKDGFGKQCRGLISEVKNSLNSPSDLDLSAHSQNIARHFPTIYRLYCEKMQEYNALDFDDLLFLTTRLFKEFPDVLKSYQKRWNYLLIDEYQDTNAAQYEIVQLLAKTHQNLCVVGDPDQSIYSWRGADISNILNFEKDYLNATVIRLEQNYRSTSNILDAANSLIQRNQNRYEKNLWSSLGKGEKLKLYVGEGDREEVQFVVGRILEFHGRGTPFQEMVIFYRTNSQSRGFEDQLLSKNIPYKIIGGISFYQRKEVKDVLAFLRVVYSSSDFMSIARTINLPKRGIGDVTLEKLRLGASEAGLPVLEFLERAIDGETQAIRLSTKQKEGLHRYLQIIRELRRVLVAHDISTLISEAMQTTGYLNLLREDKETFEDRKGNLEELIYKATEWQRQVEEPTSLRLFLEEITLRTDATQGEQQQECVSLMTLHNGKGLEYDLTFMTGLEEELFPHANSRNTPQQIEEERRLCYVGMTRAKKQLFLTAAESRFLWGMTKYMRLSRFIKEIPSKYISRLSGIGGHCYEISNPDEEVSTESTSQFSQGDFVFHQQFGTGVITKKYEGSLGETFDILFSEDQEPKSIVAKFGKLTKMALH